MNRTALSTRRQLRPLTNLKSAKSDHRYSLDFRPGRNVDARSSSSLPIIHQRQGGQDITVAYQMPRAIITAAVHTTIDKCRPVSSTGMDERNKEAPSSRTD